jgi:hypothetical protein
LAECLFFQPVSFLMQYLTECSCTICWVTLRKKTGPNGSDKILLAEKNTSMLY